MPTDKAKHEPQVIELPTADTPPATTKPGNFLRNKLFWVIAGVAGIVAIAIGIYLINPGDMFGSPAENAYVTITSDGFVPETIQVKAGQTVEWTNTDTVPHQLGADPYPSHSSLPGFYSERPVAQGETYTYTFDDAGTYTYHDSSSPENDRGTVIVE